MSNLRTGTYGQYYGSFWGASSTITSAQTQVNAVYIYSALIAAGWTAEAIAGTLGNMEWESGLNPGRWEGDAVGSGPGYGLVQWTPYTNYTNWVTNQGLSDPSTMDNNISRILWELANNQQYIPTSGYPESFREFSKSTKSPYYLACAFAWNYERSAVVLWGTEAEREALRRNRGGSAEKWYTYLTGQTPTPPDPGGGSDPGGSGGIVTARKRTGYNFVLFNRRRKFFT